MRIFRFIRDALGALAATSIVAGCAAGIDMHLSPSNAAITVERSRASVSYEVLHSFGSYSGDGVGPYAGLINVNRTLYGTTHRGGGCRKSYGCGSVFSVTAATKERVLYSFQEKPDGGAPFAGLINVKGTLYGTTFAGGATSSGTVFSITSSGSERVLYSFKGGPGDGANPRADVIDVNGTLYGTTEYGGANDAGTVFKITASSEETVIHSFGGSGDGAYPHSGLIDVNGVLYGTTIEGGATCKLSMGCGTVFAITTSGNETVLHNFKGYPEDGELPYAGLISVEGTLYGTTDAGGTNGSGTVFTITTSGAERVFYSFQGYSGGGGPEATLLYVNGSFYGTAYYGGANYEGTLFRVTKASGTETILHSFGNGSNDGTNPESALINVKGTLYGTTPNGGANHEGTVFALRP